MAGLLAAPPVVVPPREALVERARAGDAPALERLMIACRPDLERYARRHCDSDDIEEAVQDALWILYRKLGALRTVAAFTGWLFQVVRRACRGYARRRRLFLPIETLPAAAQGDPAAGDAALRARLAAVIVALPAGYRAVLVLRDVQGHSSEEVAAALGLSVAAAKSRLHRARALVREALEGGA